MNNNKLQANVLNTSDGVPTLARTIGKTTYNIRIHFSTTSHETMQDKIKRMLVNEVQQM